MFKTVRTKLMLSFFLFTFLCIAIAFASFKYSQYKERVSFTTEVVNSTYTSFLKQVKLINDFLDYDTKRPEYYQTQESQILMQYQNKKEILAQNIKTLKNQSLLGFDLEYDLNLLTDKLNEFDSIFSQMTTTIQQKGFKDYGLEGVMRKNIHELENSGQVDMLLLLNLRRHEKDYIIRNEEQYIQSHTKIAQELDANLQAKNLPQDTKNKLHQLLVNYTKAFAQFVRLGQTLGLQNNGGLKSELDNKISEIESELININVDTEKTKNRLFIQLNLYTSIVVLGLIFMSIYLGWFFSRKMTEDLSKLSSNIDLFVNSGFTDDTNLQTNKDDEIGQLIGNYMTMKKETISLFNNFKAKVERRTAEINQKKIEIQLQKEEIETQRDDLYEKNLLISQQREITEKHNKSMLDSINYAKKIQESMLPPISDMQLNFHDGFVLYLPKDIISGDFYTIGCIDVNGKQKKLVAAADCTGHGVPGALMSMMAISLLNEIVSKEHICDTAEILNKLRLNIVKSLHKGKSEKVSNDGLDIALCVIDMENKKAEFSGANRPMYLIRNNELQIIKGDKMPIGNYVNQHTPFKKVEFDIQNEDRLYLFTDGYADQFGGEDNRKFMNKRFRELIFNIHHLPMNEQMHILNKEHLSWKGERVQLDDILVIGIEIKA